MDSASLAYNLGWHEWLNLKNLILVSRAITCAALARENSTGAHFREDFPESDDLETSAYTRVSMDAGQFTVALTPVEFTRVRPGESLLDKSD